MARPGSPLLGATQPSRFGLCRSSANVLVTHCPIKITRTTCLSDGRPGLNNVCRGIITRRLTTRGHRLCCCRAGGHNRISFIISKPSKATIPVRIGSNSCCRTRTTLNRILSATRCNMELKVIFSENGIRHGKTILCLPLCTA